MERARPQLPLPTCLLPIPLLLLETYRHAYYLLGERSLPRVGNELYHQEAAWIRFHLHDAATAHRGSPEVPFFPGTDDPKCESQYSILMGDSIANSIKNVFFWFSMILGLSMVSRHSFARLLHPDTNRRLKMCVLYVLV
jgi:hypothetical protein